jgi:hypothetical protein
MSESFMVVDTIWMLYVVQYERDYTSFFDSAGLGRNLQISGNQSSW